MSCRIDALLKRGGEDGAYIISKPENIRHFSGFAGEGMLVITKDKNWIITDFRYDEQAKMEAPGWEISLIQRGINRVQRVAEAVTAVSGPMRAETDHLTFDIYTKLTSAIGRELSPLEGLPEEIRQIKEESEAELIQKAAAITDLAFSHALTVIRPGMTERELALELYVHMMKNGADGTAFSTIVASGPNGSLPHAVPTDRPFQNGDLITMDFGAAYQGYCSDFTRTVAIGKPDAELCKIYDIVLEAQLKALDALSAGKTGAEIDAAARSHIAAAGYGEAFGHGLGHAVGRMIHEEPRLSVTNENPLPVGAVVTIEPGIYLPGKGGVRIEDLCYIRENGYTNFSKSTKEFITL